MRRVLVSNVGIGMIREFHDVNRRVDKGLNVDVPEPSFLVLWTMKKEFLIFEYSDALTICQKAYFETSGREYSNTDECVGVFINNSNSAQYGSKVGKVGTEEARTVTKFDVKGLIPSLRLKIEFGDHRRICDGDVGA